MTRKAARPLVLAAALALAGATAGCGPEKSGDAAAPATSASSSSAAEPTGAASDTPGGQDRAVGDKVDFAELAAQAGAKALERKTVHASAVVSGNTLEGDIDYASRALKYTSSGAGASAAVEAIYVDGVLYFRTGGSSGDGAPWIKLDTTAIGGGGEATKPLLQGVFSLMENPMAGVSALQGVQATVTAASPEATTYQLDLSADQVKALAAKALEGTGLEGLGENGDAFKPTTYLITLDADGLLSTMETKAEGSPGVTFTYTEWGAPLTITAPPADQVIGR